MVEPDHVVVDSPELATESNAILARFGAEAVVRAVRMLAEEGRASAVAPADGVGHAGRR